MKCLSALVIGGGNRGRLAYLHFALKNPDLMKVVAVAEPDDERRKLFQKEAGISDDKAFLSADDALRVPRMADIAIIANQDRDHYEAAMMAIDRGYDLILEKPISPDEEECRRLLSFSKEKNVKVYVAHVLRFAPFYQGVKKLLDEKAIGKIIGIRMAENIGYWHFSHSYVRGLWRREELSSPSILAKCSHDLDLIVWLSNSLCSSLSSTGGQKWFVKENAPEGATERCLSGCTCRKECPFDPEKIYITNKATGCRESGFGSLIFALTPEKNEEAVRRAIEEGPYGRCVYHSDNNVADYQQIQGEMENGIEFSFTLSAFSPEVNRTLLIQGSKGEIKGDLEKKEVTVTLYGEEPRTINFNTEETFSGHGGGDGMLLKAILKSLRGDGEDISLTSLSVSMESHFMAFASEKSRKDNGKVICMEEVRND